MKGKEGERERKKKRRKKRGGGGIARAKKRGVKEKMKGDI